MAAPSRESQPVPASVPIVLVEDDRAYRTYVAALLDSVPGWRVVFQADSVEDTLAKGSKLSPRVVLLDIRLPGQSGSAAVGRLSNRWPQASIVILTGVDRDEAILEAIREGASGYILKGTSSEEVIQVVNEVLSGGAPISGSIAKKVLAFLRTPPSAQSRPLEAGEELTPRELEIVSLVAEGLSDKEIAARLNTAIPTVKTHLSNVYSKWRVRSRAEAAVRLVRSTKA